ncbi:MAG: hypothetical protein ACLUR5_06680 [Eubacterium ventriosum]
MMNTIPRYLVGQNCGINEDELLDWRKPTVHVTGSLEELRLQKFNTTGYEWFGNNKG